MNTNKTRITRPAPASEEYSEGLVFLQSQYEKAFGVIPSPPDHLLVAQQGLEIIGTIGVNVWSAETGLRLARLYRFDHEEATLPIDLPRTIEIARWACEVPGISCGLLFAASCFARKLGYRYVWCEHSLSVNRICRRFGIIFHSVPDAALNWDVIEPHHRAFYERIDSHLFMFELEQAERAMKAYLLRHNVYGVFDVI